MRKLIKIIVFAVSIFTILSMTPLVASAQSDDIIKDVNDAAVFCRELPGGTADKKYGYCAFTKSGAETPCVVSSNGSFPKFGESCNTFGLEEMVGKSKEFYRTEVTKGGGQSTQPTGPDTGSTELNGWLLKTINLLSVMVGVVVAGSIIFAGIQYSTAGGNASQVSAAKGRITMAVLSLLLFLFAFTFLQWLVPGGIF